MSTAVLKNYHQLQRKLEKKAQRRAKKKKPKMKVSGKKVLELSKIIQKRSY